jgi:hypothetical protein
MATWEDVRRLAAEFAGAKESTVYRNPAFKVRGKSLVRISRHEKDALATRSRTRQSLAHLATFGEWTMLSVRQHV